MNTIKKSLAIILTVCMLAAFIVPAASAAGTAVNYVVANVDADYELAFGQKVSGDASLGLRYVGYKGVLWGSAKPGVINKNASDNINVPLTQESAGTGWVALEITGVVAGNYTISFWSSGGTSDKTSAGKYDVYAIPSFDYSAMDEESIRAAIDEALTDAAKVVTYDFSTNAASDQAVVNFADNGAYIIVAKLAAKGDSNNHDSRAYFRTLGVYTTTSDAEATVTVAQPKVEPTEPTEPDEVIVGTSVKYKVNDVTAETNIYYKDMVSATGMYYLGYSGALWGTAKPVINTRTATNASDDVIVPFNKSAIGTGWTALEVKDVAAGNYTISFWASFDVVNNGAFDFYAIESFDYSEMAEADFQYALEKALLTAQKVASYDFSNNTGTSEVVRFANDGDYIIIAKLVADGAANTHSARCYFRTQAIWLNGSEEVNTVKIGTTYVEPEPEPTEPTEPDEVLLGTDTTYLASNVEENTAVAFKTEIGAAGATQQLYYLGYNGALWGKDVPTIINKVGTDGVCADNLNVPHHQSGIGSSWVALEIKGVLAGNYKLGFWSHGGSGDRESAGLYDIYAIESFDYSAMDNEALQAAIEKQLKTAQKVATFDFSDNTATSEIVRFAANGDYILIAKLVGIGAGNTHSARAYFRTRGVWLTGTDEVNTVKIGKTPEVLAGTDSIYLTTDIEETLELGFKAEIGAAGATQQLYYLGYSGTLWGSAKPSVINKNATDDLNVPFHQESLGSGWVAMEVTGVIAGNYTFGFWSAGGVSDKTGAGLFDIYAIPSFDYSELSNEAIQATIEKALKDAQKVATYDFSANEGTSKVVKIESDGDYIIIAKLVGVGSETTHTERAYFRTRGVWLNGSSLPESIVINADDAVEPEIPEEPTEPSEPGVTEFTVIFKDYNGNIISETVYGYGDAVIVPEEPSREGYFFVGWDKEITDCSGDAVYTAQYVAEGTVKYEIVEGQVVITGTYGNATNVIIPNIINGLSVVAIADEAFMGSTTLTSVVIPNSIQTIGKNAFNGCINLKDLTLSEGLITIDESAFNGCTALASVVVPNSVTTIGYYAFYGCTGLTSLTISDKVSNFSAVAFNGCSIKELIVAYGSQKVTSLMVISRTTLEKVTLPNTVTSIEDQAFYGAAALKEITIPNSVTNIGAAAFRGCSGLTAIDIPNSVTTIGDSAFRQCSGITTLVIPSSVTSVAYAAFRDCTGLVSVTIPDSAPIGASVFTGCSIKEIIFAQGTKTISQGMAFCESTLESVLIPNTVTTIGAYSFQNCVALKSISIPNSVTTIGDYAFNGCKGLTSVDIPNSVTTIGAAAFRDCTGVTSFNIPNSVVSFGDGAFRGCTALASVEIPNSVESIGYYAFYNCTGLTSLTISDSVTYIHPAAFTGCSIKELIVAYGTKTITSTIVVSKATLENIDIPSSVTEIGDGAFQGCVALTSISIPSSITKIGASAFRGCAGLTELTLPESVTSIGESAFRGCNGLTSLHIPSNVTSMGAYAFAYCENLVGVSFGTGITEIGVDVFRSCAKLSCVFYKGTTATKDNLTIGTGNDPLVNAEWHCLAFEAIYQGQSCFYCVECGKYFLPTGVELP